MGMRFAALRPEHVKVDFMCNTAQRRYPDVHDISRELRVLLAPDHHPSHTAIFPESTLAGEKIVSVDYCKNR